MEFYTTEDLIRILKISKTTAYKLVNSKGFPAIKFGKVVRIPKDKFESWVQTYTGKEFYI